MLRPSSEQIIFHSSNLEMVQHIPPKYRYLSVILHYIMPRKKTVALARLTFLTEHMLFDCLCVLAILCKIILRNMLHAFGWKGHLHSGGIIFIIRA